MQHLCKRLNSLLSTIAPRHGLGEHCCRPPVAWRRPPLHRVLIIPPFLLERRADPMGQLTPPQRSHLASSSRQTSTTSPTVGNPIPLLVVEDDWCGDGARGLLISLLPRLFLVDKTLQELHIVLNMRLEVNLVSFVQTVELTCAGIACVFSSQCSESVGAEHTAGPPWVSSIRRRLALNPPATATKRTQEHLCRDGADPASLSAIRTPGKVVACILTTKA